MYLVILEVKLNTAGVTRKYKKNGNAIVVLYGQYPHAQHIGKAL